MNDFKRYVRVRPPLCSIGIPKFYYQNYLIIIFFNKYKYFIFYIIFIIMN